MICFLMFHGDSVSVTARMRVEEVLASEMEDKEGGTSHLWQVELGRLNTK